MLLSKKNSHKRDLLVKESNNYAVDHIYLIQNKSHIELGYKSVTSFIKMFFEEFDADKIINKYLNYWKKTNHPLYGDKSKEDIKQLWDLKRDVSAELGTYMHRQFELYYNDEEYDTEIKEFIPFQNEIEKLVKQAYRTEWTVFMEEIKIVGNIDLVFINKDNEYCILDYKRMTTPEPNKYGQRCYIIDYFDDDITKHMLQLNIYKYILEAKYGIKIKHLYNMYVKNNDCEIVERDIIDVNKEILDKIT